MGRRRKDAIPAMSDSDDGKPPAQRNCANDRERDRMRVLSKGFTKLKTTLPWVPPDTKLSKLDTLRLATCYIAHLRQILAEDDHVTSGAHVTITDDCKQNERQFRYQVTSPMRHSECDSAVNGSNEASYGHPLSLTWPFNFNGRNNVSIPGQDTSGTLPPNSNHGNHAHRSTHHPATSSRLDKRGSQLL